MKVFRSVLLAACLFSFGVALAQSDSLSANNPPYHYTHRDSLNLARLNTTSNLMMAGGVGLCGAGVYLIYEGSLIYNTAAPNSPGDLQRNHNQGTAYIAFGAVGIGAGATLLAFGIKEKLEFKRRLKKMQLESGLLQNGDLGAMLTF